MGLLLSGQLLTPTALEYCNVSAEQVLVNVLNTIATTPELSRLRSMLRHTVDMVRAAPVEAARVWPHLRIEVWQHVLDAFTAGTGTVVTGQDWVEYATGARDRHNRALVDLLNSQWRSMELGALLKRFGAAAFPEGYPARSITNMLKRACRNKQDGVADALLQALPSTFDFAEDEGSDTVLLQACRAENTDVAMALLAFGPERCHLNHRGGNNSTALIVACNRNLRQVALAMLAHGAAATRLAFVDRAGDSALLASCSGSWMQAVALEILQLAKEPPTLEHELRTLAKACRHGMVATAMEIVRVSVHEGIARKARVLRMACQLGLSQMALALLRLGPEASGLNGPNAAGTALQTACEHRMDVVVIAMLQYGPAACLLHHAAGFNGTTPLNLACAGKMSAAALLMLSYGPAACNLGAVGGDMVTALHTACDNKLVEVALAMLAHGPEACSLGAITAAGETALSCACRRGLGRVALGMLKHGSSACCLAKGGSLANACRAGLREVALAMLAFGPAESGADMLALEAACGQGMRDVVEGLTKQLPRTWRRLVPEAVALLAGR